MAVATGFPGAFRASQVWCSCLPGEWEAGRRDGSARPRFLLYPSRATPLFSVLCAGHQHTILYLQKLSVLNLKIISLRYWFKVKKNLIHFWSILFLSLGSQIA